MSYYVYFYRKKNGSLIKKGPKKFFNREKKQLNCDLHKINGIIWEYERCICFTVEKLALMSGKKKKSRKEKNREEYLMKF